MRPRTYFGLFIFLALCGADVLLWHRILFAAQPAGLYFLDVGQGDGTLLALEDGARILVDAGPDAQVARSLEAVLPRNDWYIDLGVITHPQLDHFGGFQELLKRYTFGALVINGREADERGSGSPWVELKSLLEEHDIPLVVLHAGDRIRQGVEELTVFAPDTSLLQSAELNDTGFVMRADLRGVRALLTADVSALVEEYLIPHADLRADVLKVSHHGSKYSTGDALLAAVRPRIAVISVGRKNRYGHPAPETLARLTDSGIRVFRTDEYGTVHVTAQGGTARIVPERWPERNSDILKQ